MESLFNEVTGLKMFSCEYCEINSLFNKTSPVAASVYLKTEPMWWLSGLPFVDTGDDEVTWLDRKEAAKLVLHWTTYKLLNLFKMISKSIATKQLKTLSIDFQELKTLYQQGCRKLFHSRGGWIKMLATYGWLTTKNFKIILTKTP